MPAEEVRQSRTTNVGSIDTDCGVEALLLNSRNLAKEIEQQEIHTSGVLSAGTQNHERVISQQCRALCRNFKAVPSTCQHLDLDGKRRLIRCARIILMLKVCGLGGILYSCPAPGNGCNVHHGVKDRDRMARLRPHNQRHCCRPGVSVLYIQTLTVGWKGNGRPVVYLFICSHGHAVPHMHMAFRIYDLFYSLTLQTAERLDGPDQSRKHCQHD